MQRASASADEHPSRRRGVDHPSGGSTGERTHRQGNGSIAQNLEKEKMSSCGEEADRGRHTGDWNKQHVRGCWRGTPLDVEYVVRHGEANKSCRSLERVAQDGSGLKGAGRPQVQVQRLQSKSARHASFGLVRFCRTQWKPHRPRTFPAEGMPE